MGHEFKVYFSTEVTSIADGIDYKEIDEWREVRRPQGVLKMDTNIPKG